MVLKSITLHVLMTQKVSESIYLGFDTSKPKVKETGNVLQPFDSCLIDTCLIGSQIFNKTKDIRFLL